MTITHMKYQHIKHVKTREYQLIKTTLHRLTNLIEITIRRNTSFFLFFENDTTQACQLLKTTIRRNTNTSTTKLHRNTLSENKYTYMDTNLFETVNIPRLPTFQKRHL